MPFSRRVIALSSVGCATTTRYTEWEGDMRRALEPGTCPDVCAWRCSPHNVQDWDIVNAMVSLVKEVVPKLGQDASVPLRLLPTWSEYAMHPDSTRTRMARSLGRPAKDWTTFVCCSCRVFFFSLF